MALAPATRHDSGENLDSTGQSRSANKNMLPGFSVGCLTQGIVLLGGLLFLPLAIEAEQDATDRPHSDLLLIGLLAVSRMALFRLSASALASGLVPQERHAKTLFPTQIELRFPSFPSTFFPPPPAATITGSIRRGHPQTLPAAAASSYGFVSLQVPEIADDLLGAVKGDGCAKPNSEQGADWSPTEFPFSIPAAAGTLEETTDSLPLNGVECGRNVVQSSAPAPMPLPCNVATSRTRYATPWARSTGLRSTRAGAQSFSRQDQGAVKQRHGSATILLQIDEAGREFSARTSRCSGPRLCAKFRHRLVAQTRALLSTVPTQYVEIR